MEIKLFKLTPSATKKDHAFADFEIRSGDFGIKVKGVHVNVKKGRYYIRMPSLYREDKEPYTLVVWLTKEDADEFLVKARAIVMEVYPVEKWKEGRYCVNKICGIDVIAPKNKYLPANKPRIQN